MAGNHADLQAVRSGQTVLVLVTADHAHTSQIVQVVEERRLRQRHDH